MPGTMFCTQCNATGLGAIAASKRTSSEDYLNTTTAACLFPICGILVPLGPPPPGPDASVNAGNVESWRSLFRPIVGLTQRAASARAINADELFCIANIASACSHTRDAAVHPDCALINLLLGVWQERGSDTCLLGQGDNHDLARYASRTHAVDR